jgi:glycerol-3-phosphate dehydrogenase
MARQEKSNLSYDLVVIGGGITGIGVALEAGLRGLKTLLLEAKTLGSQTSSNSLRIMHGGFRYIKSFDIRRILDSSEAQSEILTDYRDFVEPFPCIMPLAKWGLRSRLPVGIAAYIHKLLAKSRGSPLPGAKILHQQDLSNRISGLKDSPHYSHGALLWYDAILKDPDGFMQRLISNLKELNVAIAEEAFIVGVERLAGEYRIESRSGESFYSKAVVNALGPWMEDLALKNINTPRLPLAWCRAFNLVLSRSLESKYGVAFDSGDRFFFMVPRGANSVIGTWYLESDLLASKQEIEEQHILDFIKAFNLAAQGAFEIKRTDVKQVEWGVLPSRGVNRAGPIQYKGSLYFYEDRYLEVLATKFTTFRVQGRRVIRKLALKP